MAVAIEARDVSFRVGAAQLLRGVSLEARFGEVLAVVGPNGAGKSTLLRLLAGELKPASGEVRIEGLALSDYLPKALALRRSVLPQQTLLQFAFSARDVVLMGRDPHLRDGWPSREDREIAEAQMVRTETSPFAARSYPSLSGGEQARVTMARVLTQEAPILLLDEPTSSLDIRHQELLMQVARELTAGGACVVVILHDLNLASAYADKIAVLRDGALVACGGPRTVLRAEMLSDVFDSPIQVLEQAGLPYPFVLPIRRPGD